MNLLKGTTSGPWQRDKDTGNIFVVKDDGLHGVAMAVNHADARLIAAAPDLAREVELLREIVAAVEFGSQRLANDWPVVAGQVSNYRREFSKEQEDEA